MGDPLKMVLPVKKSVEQWTPAEARSQSEEGKGGAVEDRSSLGKVFASEESGHLD